MFCVALRHSRRSRTHSRFPFGAYGGIRRVRRVTSWRYYWRHGLPTKQRTCDKYRVALLEYSPEITSVTTRDGRWRRPVLLHSPRVIYISSCASNRSLFEISIPIARVCIGRPAPTHASFEWVVKNQSCNANSPEIT
ncbi:hypothetical protein EVAR_75095_1 [Eumeta japonica]|uniref:Uncharacterized protein n=1 Tax=Eumeta variegata TaxID=151549 RepID=A0A4C1U0D6_EUMVA|nr:hypothetical protein EVAR_75095_1 [Eumeta japonica]